MVKKIIGLIVIFAGLLFFTFSFAEGAKLCNKNSDCKDQGSSNKCDDGFCVDRSLSDGCEENDGVATWSNGICRCDIQGMDMLCSDVMTEAQSNCFGGELLKDGSCCPAGSIPYDKETIGSEMTKCCDGKLYNKENDLTNKQKCCERGSALIDNNCVSCSVLSPEDLETHKDLCSDDATKCSGEMYDDGPLKKCCPGVVVPDQNDSTKKVCILNNEGTAGITMNADCLINGQCSYNIYETLGIRKSDPDPSVGSFVQDIVLAVTMFIGTVVAIILVVSGILYIVSGIKGDTSMADKAKKGIVNSIMGLILVLSSYAIVRLVQFLVTAGGG